MFQKTLAFVIAAAIAACGGGGGQDPDELSFGEAVPSEATLCTFTMGATTRDQVEATLGDPTHFNDDTSGSSVQYWYGETSTPTGIKIVLLSFDGRGIFESAVTSQFPYPQCWRDRERDEDDVP